MQPILPICPLFLPNKILTQLYTCNYIIEKFQKSRKNSISAAITMADIDNFKYINDTYGHAGGDYVLFTISTIMKTVCHTNIDISRWGGEEFILVLYQKSKEEVLSTIQNLREAIAAYNFQFSGNEFHVTATFGISFTHEKNILDDLIQLADERMYHGKRSGKNRIIAD